MPALLTANVLGIEVKTVYVAVRTARKKGWLSESVSGSAKGELTSDGLKEFKKIGGQALYEEYISGIIGGKK
jgi:transposase